MTRTITSALMKNSANLPEREVDIPFYDVARANGDVEAEILAALTSTLSDGWFILGPRLSAFAPWWHH